MKENWFKILIFAFILIIVMKILACNSDTKELIEIGKNLVVIDSITDFSTNRNHPVPKIENIGTGLYNILRSGRNAQSVISVKSGDFGGETNADYILLIERKDSSKLGIRIKKVGDTYRILGYSGGW